MDEVFDGDEEAFVAVKAASDGFEHGYMAINDVRDLADQVLARSMGSVRQALIEAAGIGPQDQLTLLGAGYAEPRGLVPALAAVTGELVLKDPSKPAPAHLGALEFDYVRTAPKAMPTPDGKVVLEHPMNITATYLPPNVEVRVTGAVLRAAHVTHVQTRIDSMTKATLQTDQEPPTG